MPAFSAEKGIRAIVLNVSATSALKQTFAATTAYSVGVVDGSGAARTKENERTIRIARDPPALIVRNRGTQTLRLAAVDSNWQSMHDACAFHPL